MDDLISRQAVELRINEYFENDSYTAEMLRIDIHNLPSAQPEIIHCRDCKYWQNQEEGVVEVPICARPENKYEKLPFRFFIDGDGYCSFAERRKQTE